jgi:hypothetical protein
MLGTVERCMHGQTDKEALVELAASPAPLLRFFVPA